MHDEPLLPYPRGLLGADLAPRVYCLSLGEADGMLAFNGLVVPGWPAAVAKRLIEWTKVAQAAERPIGVFAWRVADVMAACLSRTLLPVRPPPAPLATKEGAALLLFDSVCLMCSAFVNWVVAHDASNVFRFAPLQSHLGEACLQRAGLPLDLSTLVLIDEDGVHTRSTAALRVLRRCSGCWPLVHNLLVWVPRPLRDLGYRGVAAVRYKVFGRVIDDSNSDTCW